MIMTRVAAELTGPPVSLRNRPREVVQQPDLAEVFAGSEGGDQAWRGLVVLRAEHSEPALVVEVGRAATSPGRTTVCRDLRQLNRHRE
jgi:hypothetical protein